MNDILRLKRRAEFPKIPFINPNARQVINRLKNQGFRPLGDLMSPVDDEFGNDTYLTKLYNKLKESEQSRLPPERLR